MRNLLFSITILCLLLAAIFAVGQRAASSNTLGAWVKDEDNPVLRPGAPGAWDDASVESPEVIHDGTQFHMWYTGFKAGSQSSQIGHATSSDGVTWVKDPNNPALEAGIQFDWDAAASAPTVIFNPLDPDPNQRWRMWYVGRGPAFNFSIGYAYSADGVTWEKSDQNPVLEPTFEGEAWDDDSVLAPTVHFRDGQYHMWYAARGAQLQIGYATSPDGVVWTQHNANPVLTPGTINQWDNGEIAAPAVRVGSQYEMWYQGVNLFLERTYIGYATASNATGWSKAPVNPVMGGGPEAWDAYSVFYPTVLEHNGVLLLWYHGIDAQNGVRQIGLARFQSNTAPTAVPEFPTPTPTPPPTPTPSVTPTPSITPTPSSTPTAVPTNTATPTATASGTATNVPANTVTATPTATASGTATNVPANTVTPTPTATASGTATNVPANTVTPTPTATASATSPIPPTSTVTPTPRLPPRRPSRRRAP